MTTRAAAQASPPRAEVRIDLSAYRRNLMALRDRLTGDAQLWAVVKANAYGHDVDRLAQEAVAAGARRLCVATLSEARQLRQHGIRASMLVMGPLDEPSIRRAADLQVSFAVLGPQMLAHVEQAAAARAFTADRPARVHLKVDTGMGRWGVAHEVAIAALERLLALDAVEVEGVMTHFATADEPDDDGFLDLQLDRFLAIVERARELVPGIVAHAANSAATLRDPRTHLDAVRCGVATYGMDPMQRDPREHGLEPVLSLRSHVAHVARVASGDSTGYGRTWVASESACVARVPIGYADGVRRALGNVGRVLVRGIERPIIGTVSMDHISVLVDDGVREGEVVTVIGADGEAWIGAEHHARWAGTINYEVTCGIAGEPRLLRAHVQGR